MSKLSYWERRQVENMYQYMQSAEDVADQIAKLYLRASRWLSLSMEDIFERYMTKHNLSEKEARKLLNELHDRTSIDEMMQKLQNGDSEKKELAAKLESLPYRARIERLKQLQNQLDYVMKNVYEQEKAINTAHYVDLANEAYYRTIFDLQQRAQTAFSFGRIDQKMIDDVVNTKWSGENYSSRIWKNTKALAQDVKEELLINLVTGRTERETAEIIANKFAQGASNARRLVRTESAYLSTELNIKALKEADVEEYQFMATLDLKTSEICRKMDLKIFKVSDRKVGVNCPPMHPWCRSTIVAIVDRKYLEDKKRAAIDPETGERIFVPRNMTYEEWYKKYVKGKTKAETSEKKLKSKSADQKQHERYKAVLGDNIPDNLDDFQEMKYNDGEKWKFTQLDYRRRKELIDNPNLRLPNAENVVLPEAKFTKYLFGGNHAEGLAKGKAFETRLGYTSDNWENLRNAIQESAGKYPAIFKDNNGYGDRYEQKIVLYGIKGTPANVVVGWLHKLDDTLTMSSVYIKEVKEK